MSDELITISALDPSDLVTVSITETTDAVTVTAVDASDQVTVSVAGDTTTVEVTADSSSDLVSITSADPSDAVTVSVTTADDAVTVSVSNDTGPAGADFAPRTDWLSLCTGYSATPTGPTAITGGGVYTYTYTGGTRYRFVSTDALTDRFYTGFDGTNLTGLVATKSVTIA